MEIHFKRHPTSIAQSGGVYTTKESCLPQSRQESYLPPSRQGTITISTDTKQKNVSRYLGKSKLTNSVIKESAIIGTTQIDEKGAHEIEDSGSESDDSADHDAAEDASSNNDQQKEASQLGGHALELLTAKVVLMLIIIFVFSGILATFEVSQAYQQEIGLDVSIPTKAYPPKHTHSYATRVHVHVNAHP